MTSAESTTSTKATEWEESKFTTYVHDIRDVEFSQQTVEATMITHFTGRSVTQYVKLILNKTIIVANQPSIENHLDENTIWQLSNLIIEGEANEYGFRPPNHACILLSTGFNVEFAAIDSLEHIRFITLASSSDERVRNHSLGQLRELSRELFRITGYLDRNPRQDYEELD